MSREKAHSGQQRAMETQKHARQDITDTATDVGASGVHAAQREPLTRGGGGRGGGGGGGAGSAAEQVTSEINISNVAHMGAGASSVAVEGRNATASSGTSNPSNSSSASEADKEVARLRAFADRIERQAAKGWAPEAEAYAMAGKLRAKADKLEVVIQTRLAESAKEQDKNVGLNGTLTGSAEDGFGSDGGGDDKTSKFARHHPTGTDRALTAKVFVTHRHSDGFL